MKKQNLFCKLLFTKCKPRFERWQFWAWVMDNHPKIFDWCDKHLPFDTLPF